MFSTASSRGDKAPSPAKTDLNFFALASTNSARLFRQAVHMICMPLLPTKRQSRAISSSKIHQINFFMDFNMFMTLSPDLRQIYPTCKLLRRMLDSPFISSNSSLMLVSRFSLQEYVVLPEAAPSGGRLYPQITELTPPNHLS